MCQAAGLAQIRLAATLAIERHVLTPADTR
jgi:hypothetical protein